MKGRYKHEKIQFWCLRFLSHLLQLSAQSNPGDVWLVVPEKSITETVHRPASHKQRHQKVGRTEQFTYILSFFTLHREERAGRILFRIRRTYCRHRVRERFRFHGERPGADLYSSCRFICHSRSHRARPLVNTLVDELRERRYARAISTKVTWKQCIAWREPERTSISWMRLKQPYYVSGVPILLNKIIAT